MGGEPDQAHLILPPSLAASMHALVTGGGGFLGGYIVEALLARGDRVRSFGRGEYPALVAQGVDVVRGDIRDNEALSKACAEIECVFHAAALPGIGMEVARWLDRKRFLESRFIDRVRGDIAHE